MRTAAGTGMHRLFSMFFILLLCVIGGHMCAKVYVWRLEDKLVTLLLFCYLMPVVVETELR